MTGVEVQALFNWLINCRSAVSNTGPHAGIPPTLLAPVAFSGATLTPLKVRKKYLLIITDLNIIYIQLYNMNNTDFQKAFDTVDHNSLIDLLDNLGFGNSFLSWLSSYLNSRR